MKKFILISMIAVAAMGIIGCGEDDKTKADLKWKNEHTADVSEIKWIHNSEENQSWSGTCVANTGETEFKGISELSGEGECVEGGSVSQIVLDTSASTGVATMSANSAVINENAAAILVIDSAKKK